WNILNTLGCDNAIEDMLEVKVNEMGSDEVLFTSEAWKFDDKLITKKAIKLGLCGQDYAMSILDFAKRLGLYTGVEIQDYRFETYFIGGLRNDDDFNADQYWLNISSEEALTFFRSSVKTIAENDHIWITKRLGILSDEVLNGLNAPTYCRTLDANALKELIGSNGRLIPKEIIPTIPKVVTPRVLHPTTSDMYDKIGQLETRIGDIERMMCRQSNHSDRYARVLEFIVWRTLDRGKRTLNAEGKYNTLIRKCGALQPAVTPNHNDEH
ncbi:hypothetical protein Tco_1395006, partial [Tanacetum coccineum]